MELEHYCQAWPIEGEMPDDEASSGHEFVVEMEVTHSYVLEDEDDSGDLQLYTGDTLTLRETFQVKRDNLLNESTASFTVSDMLSILSVPLHIQDFMVSRILDCAGDMVRRKPYAGRKVLGMCVVIEVTHEESDPLNTYVLGLPASDQVCGLVPASKSAIEALEKVKIEETAEACTICLEDLHGSAAARMPCLHLFHHQCIVNWLETSNFCPMCRFALPGRE